MRGRGFADASKRAGPPPVVPLQPVYVAAHVPVGASPPAEIRQRPDHAIGLLRADDGHDLHPRERAVYLHQPVKLARVALYGRPREEIREDLALPPLVFVRANLPNVRGRSAWPRPVRVRRSRGPCTYLLWMICKLSTTA